MSLLAWLAGLFLISLIGSACVVAVIMFFDPYSAGWPIFTLFYASLFVASTSILSLIGWLIRRLSRVGKIPMSITQAMHQLEISFRQGVLLSAILVTALILQGFRVLTWWNILILVALVVLAEWILARK